MGDEWQELIAADFKNALGEANSNRDNGHDFPLSCMLMKSTISILPRWMSFAVTSPLPWDEEVPFIR